MLQIISNATIVYPDRIAIRQAVIIKDDRIFRIVPMEKLCDVPESISDALIHDADDSFVTAGFIDIHSDTIETVIQPRPTSIIDTAMALMEHEKQLVNQGITTMYHSLSFLRQNDGAITEKEARKPHKLKELVELIQLSRQGQHLIRHRFHCRFDIRNMEGYEALMEYMEKDYIHLLSFIDHTPGQGQYRSLEKYRSNMKNYKPHLDNEEIDNLIKEKQAVPVISAELIEQTASNATQKGIPIASHDDDSIGKLDYAIEKWQAVISEFPVELDVARMAKEKGMHTVAGAPNILLGRSHSGNMSALDAVKAGYINILCSDYYPPSLLHAVFKLYTEHHLALWDAMNLVTLNPARAMGNGDDFGSIQEGKKADLLVIRYVNEKPAITRVFIDGQCVSELNYRRVKSFTGQTDHTLELCNG